MAAKKKPFSKEKLEEAQRVIDRIKSGVSSSLSGVEYCYEEVMYLKNRNTREYAQRLDGTYPTEYDRKPYGS